MTLQGLKYRFCTNEGRKQTLEEGRVFSQLVSNDLRSRYSGSALGIVWAYIQPLVTILVFWFVYQIGFRNPPVDQVEFILWFMAGFIPWTFFSDGINSAANVMYEYSYLVKKMKFRVYELPFIKLFSSLKIHLFFLVFMAGMYMLYGHGPYAAWLGVLYYTGCICCLLTGLSFLVSSLTVFMKDMAPLVNVILQIGFWLTPIFWSDATMSPTVLTVLKCNPLYYVITGTRNALISGTWFWNMPLKLTLYFWGSTLVVNILGITVYRHLRQHFTDLL